MPCGSVLCCVRVCVLESVGTCHACVWFLSTSCSSIQVGDTVCGTSSWSSSTGVRCYNFVTGLGIGASRRAILTVSASVGVAGTRINLFTYDSPVLTSFVQPNSASSGSTFVTIAGVCMLLRMLLYAAATAAAAALTVPAVCMPPPPPLCVTVWLHKRSW